MNRILLRLLLLPVLLLSSTAAFGQQVAVKTNVLYWAATTPNLTVEAAVNDKITVQLSGSYNPFRFSDKADNKKLWHTVIMSEARYWLYEKYDGHFLGVHPFYIKYNASGIKLPFGLYPDLKDNRFEGQGFGVGFSYGYQWYLGRHWNLEATIGVGYAYHNYDQFECRKCGAFKESVNKHWYGPTKLGVSFVYLIKSNK